MAAAFLWPSSVENIVCILGYGSVCGRSGIPFSLLEDPFQKGSQNLCRLPVVLCAGVLPGTTLSPRYLGAPFAVPNAKLFADGFD